MFLCNIAVFDSARLAPGLSSLPLKNNETESFFLIFANLKNVLTV